MKRKRSLVVRILFLSLSILAAVTAYRFVSFWGAPSVTGPQKFVFYEVHPLENPMTTAIELEKLNVISDAKLFYWYVRLTGKIRRFKAGDYRFSTRMRPTDVAATIMSGISYGIPLVVPEGFSMFQIAEAFEGSRSGGGQRLLQLCRDKKFIANIWATLDLPAPPPMTLEGYLYPDTYLVGRKEPEDELIRRMVKKFKGTFNAEMMDRARFIGMSMHQIVTLASIVEKETGAKHERPLISAVFHNRLKKRMKLQSDPTSIYGVADYAGNITRKHLDTHTPYNTYKIYGLPVGPISNPGRDALMAALYPAETENLYFVSHNDGTHEFTPTYEAHRKAVIKYQLNPKAREGKSWRDLNKPKPAETPVEEAPEAEAPAAGDSPASE